MGSKAWAGDTETTGLATHQTIFTHLANSLRMCSLRRYIKKDRKTPEPQTKRKQHYLVAAVVSQLCWAGEPNFRRSPPQNSLTSGKERAGKDGAVSW